MTTNPNGTAMTTDAVPLVAGIDIGNGYVKAKVQAEGEPSPHVVDMPSCVAYTAQATIPKEPTRKALENLANTADADVRSDAMDVMSQGRALFGERAVRSGRPLSEFDIDAARPKCEDPLQTMLILDVLAAEALRAWSARVTPADARLAALPETTIRAEATLALALPIEDYVQNRTAFARKLKGGSHVVRFLDFERPVNVEVKVVDVVVLAEGAAGQYAIQNLGPAFLDAALQDARARGLAVDAAYTGEVLVGARDTIGIDIGEGTVNFPVFTDGDVSIEASSSIRRGWGSVLSDVVSRLRSTAASFGSRKALSDFLTAERVLPAQARLKADVMHEVADASRVFAREVMAEFGSVWRRVGIRTDVVYVYGGGATPMREVLWPLVTDTATIGTGDAIPVVWMDSSYSRDLNRNGLFVAAQLARERRAAKGR